MDKSKKNFRHFLLCEFQLKRTAAESLATVFDDECLDEIKLLSTEPKLPTLSFVHKLGSWAAHSFTHYKKTAVNFNPLFEWLKNPLN